MSQQLCLLPIERTEIHRSPTERRPRHQLAWEEHQLALDFTARATPQPRRKPRFTQDEVHAIRRLARTQGLNAAEIARQYGKPKSTIWRILRHRSWQCFD